MYVGCLSGVINDDDDDDKKWRILLEQSFAVGNALADVNWRIRIREKTLHRVVNGVTCTVSVQFKYTLHNIEGNS